MRNSIGSLLRLLLATTFLPATLSAEVWIVNANGSEDFVHIQHAVDAAADGDTILVERRHEDAHAESIVVDGKGLILMALDGQRLPIGFVDVRNLGPAQTFVLSGFQVLARPPAGASLPGILAQNNGGPIRIQDCTVMGSPPPSTGSPGTHAVQIRTSTDVVLSHCAAIGQNGWRIPNDGGFGILARSSRIRIYSSSIEGGEGSYGKPTDYDPARGGAGGDGARVYGGALGLVHSSLAGGRGGTSGGGGSYGAIGGNGLSILNGALVESIQSSFTLGPGGSGVFVGEDGVEIRGQVSTIAGEVPVLRSASSFGAGGSTIALRINGTPGDSVVLLQSRRTGAVPITPEQGVLHALAPVRSPVGVIPSSGELEYSLTLPGVVSGATMIHVQAEVQQGTAPPRLSNPMSLVVLDDEHAPECGLRVYVDQGASPGGDGRSWATAFHDLRTALDEQHPCPNQPTEVWVAEGTYRPAPPAGDPSLSFRLAGGVHLYGGFAGTETMLAQRDPRAHPVILSGDLNGDDLPGFQNRSDNSRHVVQTGSIYLCSRNVRLDGVTVRGGQTTGEGTSSIVDPYEFGGAGIRSRCEGLLVARCTVEDNRTSNNAHGGAGLLQFAAGDTTVVESLFQGNAADRSGAGIRIAAQATVNISNCIVRGNVSAALPPGYVGGGGGIDLGCFDGSLTGTTVYANSAGSVGGVRVVASDAFQVANLIVWGNTDTDSDTSLLEGNFSPVFLSWSNLQHSCIEGWSELGGGTNTELDPQFVDPLGSDGIPGTMDDDLRLGQSSPCVDAGSNRAVLSDVADLDGDGNRSEPSPTDSDHLRRFVDDPLVPDTGAGMAPLVDMGAFERRGP